MRKILLLFLLTVGVVKASAQEEVLLTRQAEAYFQAGEYDKSIELYQKLEDEKLLPWQHARIIYNIGTNSLEQNNSEALSEFTTIPYSPKTAPPPEQGPQNKHSYPQIPRSLPSCRECRPLLA